MLHKALFTCFVAMMVLVATVAAQKNSGNEPSQKAGGSPAKPAQSINIERPASPADAAETQPETPAPAGGDANRASAQNNQPEVKRRFGCDKFNLTPSLNLGLKSQFAETHFPESSRPGRSPFTDATISGSWKSEMARGAMAMQQQFDIVGSGFRNEALRFGTLGAGAPKIDLSSYSMQFQQATLKFNSGHSTFGSHRHLINNLASRGLTLTVPLNSRVDVGAVAMNATNIAGWDDFFGLANRRHRLFGGVLGVELLNRPGRLRFEGGTVDGWFQPARQNFNQANVNDAERSRGWSARLLAKDKTERAARRRIHAQPVHQSRRPAAQPKYRGCERRAFAPGDEERAVRRRQPRSAQGLFIQDQAAERGR